MIAITAVIASVVSIPSLSFDASAQGLYRRSITPSYRAYSNNPTYRSYSTPTYRSYSTPSNRYVAPSNLNNSQAYSDSRPSYSYGPGTTYSQSYPQYVAPNQRYSSGYRGNISTPNYSYQNRYDNYSPNAYGGAYYGVPYYGTPGQQRGAALGGAIGEAIGGSQSGNIGAAIGNAIGGQ